MKMLIVYMVLGLVSATSSAYDMGPFINREMSKVEDKSNLREESVYQHQWENLQPKQADTIPLKSLDPALQNLEPIRGSELLGTGIDRPQTGVIKAVDPTLTIQNEIAEKDQYLKTRNNYRKAVQREFVRRAQEAGVNTAGRNIAEEIKELEEKTHSAR